MDKIQEQQIIEGLEAIKKFMGYELKQGKELAKYIAGGNTTYIVGENFTVDEASWNPYENWNHLMPVVEKIESEQGCIIEMWLSLGKGCRINRLQPKGSNPITIPFIAESNSLIECVYSAVVQFITWYTTTQTKNK